MLRQIWALTLKELKIWARHPGQWIVLFFVPLVSIWIFNSVFGVSSGPAVVVYLVEEDRGKLAQAVVKALQESPNLRLEMLQTRDEADGLVGQGRHLAALVIPRGFSDAVLAPTGATIEIIVDPAQANQAGIVSGLVTQALEAQIVDAEITRGVNAGVKQALQFQGSSELESVLDAAVKGVVASKVQDALDRPQVRVVMVSTAPDPRARPPSLMEGLVPGYSLMFVFFLVSTLVSTVMEERSNGTLRRLLILPAPRAILLLGKALPYALLSVAQMAAVMLVSGLVFGLNLGGSPAALLLVILCASTTVAGLGILIAALSRSEGQAGTLTILVVILLAACSGSMFPDIRIPVMEYFTPHYWAILGFQNVVSRGMGLQGALLPAGVLLAIGLGMFFLGARRFRYD